ncbi:MAG TPA: DNA gyrase inhibitor YacG [Lacipirellulaceae bacterium]|nr:DNA gyrase inhibitor YacG [Lacipirellulaceae bacterium]
MRCPICNREFERETSSALPFCSERCRTIDLGRWLGESYHLRVIPDPEGDEVPEDQPGSPGNQVPDEPE